MIHKQLNDNTSQDSKTSYLTNLACSLMYEAYIQREVNVQVSCRAHYVKHRPTCSLHTQWKCCMKKGDDESVTCKRLRWTYSMVIPCFLVRYMSSDYHNWLILQYLSKLHLKLEGTTIQNYMDYGVYSSKTVFSYVPRVHWTRVEESFDSIQPVGSRWTHHWWCYSATRWRYLGAHQCIM